MESSTPSSLAPYWLDVPDTHLLSGLIEVCHGDPVWLGSGRSLGRDDECEE